MYVCISLQSKLMAQYDSNREYNFLAIRIFPSIIIIHFCLHWNKDGWGMLIPVLILLSLRHHYPYKQILTIMIIDKHMKLSYLNYYMLTCIYYIF